MTVAPTKKRKSYNAEACVLLICTMVEWSVNDYKALAQSGYLAEPFKIKPNVLDMRRGVAGARCVMLEKDSAKTLLWFLESKYLDRALTLANLPICAERTRASLTEFFNLHNK